MTSMNAFSTQLASLIATTILATSIATTSAWADSVFKQTSPDGTVEFSDTPTGGDAERIEVETPTTYDFRTTSPLPQSRTEPTQKEQGYSNVSIISPAPDSTIRSNAGNLNVTGKVEPRLQRNHQVVLQSNGSTVGGPQKGLSFSLNNLDRGTHTLTLSVVDEKGKTLMTSQATTINILRAAAGR